MLIHSTLEFLDIGFTVFIRIVKIIAYQILRTLRFRGCIIGLSAYRIKAQEATADMVLYML